MSGKKSILITILSIVTAAATAVAVNLVTQTASIRPLYALLLLVLSLAIQARLAIILLRSIPPPPPRRSREQMLTKVRRIWINNFLDPSLPGHISIPLMLHQQPDAVTSPTAKSCNRDPIRKAAASGASIYSLFDQSGDGLLILGASGAGKTTLLLELTRHLIDRAEADADFWIPVVFRLATWAPHRGALDDWLISELQSKYDVPRAIATSWIHNAEILPLLDSLDEVRNEYRGLCIRAINDFRGRHGIPAVITSQPDAYHCMAEKLRLGDAFIIRPLIRSQVANYLTLLGDTAQHLRRALARDPDLWTLLSVPLMLNTAVNTYGSSHVGQNPDLSSHRLFANFIAEMFRRAQLEGVSQTKFMSWIKWLAQRMAATHQDIFMLEEVDRVVPTNAAVLIHRLEPAVISSVFALVCTGLALGTSRAGWPYAAISALQAGVIGGWLGWANVALRGREFSLIGVSLRFGEFVNKSSVDRLEWSWNRAIRKAPFILRVMLPRLGVPILIPVMLATAVNVGFLTALVVLLVGLALFFHWRLLQDALVPSNEIVRTWPNEGFRRSLRNSLLALMLAGVPLGLGAGFFFGAMYGFPQGIVFGAVAGLYVGLIAALGKGAYFCMHHAIVRVVLWRYGYAPLRYIRVLNLATALTFMRRIDSGYVFVHPRFAEYFASCDTSGGDTKR